MKAKRIIYLTVGILFVLLNLLTDIMELSEKNYSGDNPSYSLGYFIGSHIFLFFGLVLLRLAYKQHKKIKIEMQNRELNNQIDSIGKI
jgi:hypothetical protein